MFEHSYGIEGKAMSASKPSASKPMERCKPDYEAMIKRCEQQKDACQKFLTAAVNLESLDITIRDEFLKVVGQVYMYAAQMVGRIDQLMTMQEQDS